jgi:hypothetical protein
MKLNRKQQLEALCTALGLGMADYQRNAAIQTDYANLDGVLHATSRMVFLRYLNEYFTGQLRKEESDNDTFPAVFEELAILAGVNVRNTLQYSAVDKGSNDGASGGVVDREGSG